MVRIILRRTIHTYIGILSMHRLGWPKELRIKKQIFIKIFSNWARTEMVSQAPRHVTIESGVQPEELPG